MTTAGEVSSYEDALGQLVRLTEQRERYVRLQLENAREIARAEGWRTSHKIGECEGALAALSWVLNIAAALVVDVGAD